LLADRRDAAGQGHAEADFDRLGGLRRRGERERAQHSDDREERPDKVHRIFLLKSCDASAAIPDESVAHLARAFDLGFHHVAVHRADSAPYLLPS
jgi:hypothetical protein